MVAVLYIRSASAPGSNEVRPTVEACCASELECRSTSSLSVSEVIDQSDLAIVITN